MAAKLAQVSPRQAVVLLQQRRTHIRLQACVPAWMQRDYCYLPDCILQPAISRMLARILPAVKREVTAEILRTTRVFACTVDSTPRMVFELQIAGVS